jgi:hypothetical protein
MEDVMAPASNTVPQSPKSLDIGERAARPAAGSGRMVRQFRQILLWPLQLIPSPQGTQAHGGDFLAAIASGADPRWTEINDEFPDDPSSLQEHTYREFVSFLPHVQRFLYGARASRSARSGSCESPVKVFSRHDIVKMRITPIAGTIPLLFNVARVELRFFCDVDVVILAVEIEAQDLAFEQVQEVMYRFGRAYPSGWTDTGQAWHCPERVEWLDREGRALATSDYERRERFLTSVCRHQVPTIASHWKFLLAPLTVSQSDEIRPLTCRLVEHNWIPIMAYVAVDDPASLTANDHARLGLVLPPGDPASAPYAATFLQDFNDGTATTASTILCAPATGSTRASCAVAMRL